MPIVHDDEMLQQNINTQPTQIKSIAHTTDNIKPISIDTRFTPPSNVITLIDGDHWEVDYYSQVLTTTSEPKQFQVTLSNTSQQYKKIERLALKVTDNLTTNQTDTNEMVSTGRSIMESTVIPNQYDVFLANIGEGRSGIFSINTVRKLSIFTNAVYEIEYSLISDEEIKIQNLDSKVIENYNYVKEFLLNGNNPLIIKDEYEDILTLRNTYKKYVEIYLKKFYNNNFSTIILPQQDISIYDPYINNFLSKTISGNDGFLINDVKLLNTSNDVNDEHISIYDVIFNRDIDLLSHCFKKYGTVNSKQFNIFNYSSSITYSGVSQCIYPKDPITFSDNLFKDTTIPVQDLNLVEDDSTIIILANENIRVLQDGVQANNIHKINSSDYYVLTSNFYNNNQASFNNLEKLILSFIKKEYNVNNNKNLINILLTFQEFTKLQQFYFIPIILYMVKTYLSGEK